MTVELKARLDRYAAAALTGFLAGGSAGIGSANVAAMAWEHAIELERQREAKLAEYRDGD